MKNNELKQNVLRLNNSVCSNFCYNTFSLYMVCEINSLFNSDSPVSLALCSISTRLIQFFPIFRTSSERYARRGGDAFDIVLGSQPRGYERFYSATHRLLIARLSPRDPYLTRSIIISQIPPYSCSPPSRSSRVNGAVALSVPDVV